MLLELLLQLGFALLRHFGEGNVNPVLLFLDRLFEALTVLLDNRQLRLVPGFLLADLLHLVEVLFQLVKLRVEILDLLLR